MDFLQKNIIYHRFGGAGLIHARVSRGPIIHTLLNTEGPFGYNVFFKQTVRNGKRIVKNRFNPRFKEETASLVNTFYKSSFWSFSAISDIMKLIVLIALLGGAWASYEGEHHGGSTYHETHKTVEVPIYKKYAIPIPHPVPVAVPQHIKVPIPQPYQVQVPIPHPVPVEVVKHVEIPVEKPEPYVVEKKVPYVVEKPYPVTVEKHFPVPIPKPYPVHVPVYKHVFHHQNKHHGHKH
ncbi:uncharacterized protein [Prorops nasuta]|uniref:uncharacterized protein n=1 Tax=Prorops nasuta TaxID=863751 RepID=UPI0034CFD42D